MESEQQPCLCCELGLSNGHGGPRGGALKCVDVDGWVEEFADDMMMDVVEVCCAVRCYWCYG